MSDKTKSENLVDAHAALTAYNDGRLIYNTVTYKRYSRGPDQAIDQLYAARLLDFYPEKVWSIDESEGVRHELVYDKDGHLVGVAYG